VSHVSYRCRTLMWDGFAITTIDLDTQGNVPDIDEKEFLKQAEIAKKTCPVSQVLKGAEISLKARLVSPVTASP